MAKQAPHAAALLYLGRGFSCGPGQGRLRPPARRQGITQKGVKGGYVVSRGQKRSLGVQHPKLERSTFVCCGILICDKLSSLSCWDVAEVWLRNQRGYWRLEGHMIWV